jgi:hypothetical protein
MMLTYSFCSFAQASLEPAGGEKWLFFSVQSGIGRLPQARGPGCHRVVGRRKRKKERKEGRKKREAAGGFSPRAGAWTCLAGCAGWDSHSC